MQRKNPLIILILGALTTISPFSIDMYLPAFRQIAEEFHTTAPHVALSLSSYFIGLALGQIFYGPFLDRFGRKKPLYFGLALYVLSSIACMYSTSAETLIVYRLFQALGGCAASVGSNAMVRDFFSPKDSAKVYSMLMLILSVSPLFAPTVGGFIASAWGWRAVFLTLMGIVLLISLVVYFLLPEGHEPDPTVQLNLRAITAGFAEIFNTPTFFTYCLSGAFSFAGLFVYLAGAPDLFLNTYHLSTRNFGMVFAFLSVGMIGGGQINILLSKYFSIERIYQTALTAQLAAALVFLIGASLGWYGLYLHILIFFTFISCVGLVGPNSAALSLAPFERNAGSAAALLGFLQMGVGALASAGFSLIPFGPSLAMAILFSLTTAVGFFIKIRSTV